MGINKVQYGNTVLIDLTDTTAVASDVLAGKYFYGKDGVKTLGTCGGSVTQDQDGYIVLPSTGGGGGGGATQHVIHLEFTDSTDTDINVYYDDSLISTMITAYTPETYGQKTVDVAELDGVEWYHRSTAQWETLLDSNNIHVNSGDPYNDLWLSDLGSVSITVGSIWRITVDADTYVLTATANGVYGSPYENIIGNPLYSGGTDDGSTVPFCLEQNPWGAWAGWCAQSITGGIDHALKVERQITA